MAAVAPDPQNQANSGPLVSWQMLVVLAVALSGMWLWYTKAEAEGQPLVDYSTFYGWLESGKVAAVVFRGPGTLEGTLKAPEQLRGAPTKVFRSLRPDGDDALLPLLRSQRVQLQVTTDEQPFLGQILVGAFPWLLVIGVGFPFLGQRIAIDGGASDATLHTIEAEARKLLASALSATSQLLADHGTELERLERALLARETLERADLQALLYAGGTEAAEATP